MAGRALPQERESGFGKAGLELTIKTGLDDSATSHTGGNLARMAHTVNGRLMQATHSHKHRRKRLPKFDDWESRKAVLGLRRQGKRLVGPCPRCGGSSKTTKFHVSERGFFCWSCCPKGNIDDALAIAALAGFDTSQTEPVEPAEPIDHAALRSPPPEPPPSKQVEFLLAAAEPVPPAGIARDYLAGRHCWPPAAIDAPLPDSVRWIAASNLADAKSGLKGIPHGTIGALAFVWQPPQPPGKPSATSLMALDKNAERLLWFNNVKTFGVGQRKGTAFAARRPDDSENHIAEGELDALALTWQHAGGCLATGGTSGLAAAAQSLAGSVVIHADGDYAGRSRATLAAHEAGTCCCVDYCAAGYDPASELAAELNERAAIREHGGLNADDAAIAAWIDLFPKLNGMNTK